MTTAHEIRGRLHSARLHLTFLARALAKPGADPELVDAVSSATDELRHLERLILASLALGGPADPAETP